MAFPESEPISQQPEINPDINHIPEQPTISEQVEKAGVQVVPHSPPNLVDQKGQTIAQSVSPQVPTIQIPATPEVIHGWAKGSPTNSQTWLGVFWERVIKRALIYGKHIVVGNSSNA